MYRVIAGAMAVALLAGCSSKEEQALMASYTQKNQYHKNLLHTEKAEFSNAESTIAILTATHLYTKNLDKNDTRDELFIVGVQFEDESSKLVFDKTPEALASHEFALTLNGVLATKVELLSNESKLLKDVSFVTEWGDYYRVTFPNGGSRFALLFLNPLYGEKRLEFSKKPKYVYTKKGF